MEWVAAQPPHQCTLVPDSNDQLTSDHGFDLAKDGKRLQPVIEKLKSLDIRVSLFMDPDLAQIERASDIGADRIELYTGPYALRSEEHTSELQSRGHLACRLLLEKTDAEQQQPPSE